MEITEIGKFRIPISLGRNCEVSWMIQEYIEKLEASLFSWAFVTDEELFLKALENINDIFMHGIHYHVKFGDMFIDDKYKIAFHGRTAWVELFDEEMNIKNADLYEKTVLELKERVEYLKAKFCKQVENKDNYFFIKTYKITKENRNDVLFWIRRLGEWGRKVGGLLIIVIEKEWYGNEFIDIEQEFPGILFMRTVDHFTPTNEIFKIEKADKNSWMDILREFLGTALAAGEAVLIDKLKSYQSVVIYGAGNVARTVIRHLKANYQDIAVSAIVVTKYEGNPYYIQDIPVIQIDELEINQEKEIVLVATMERVQADILMLLKKIGINNIILMKDLLYEVWRC